MDVNELVSAVIDFRDARDWKQFHKPHHLAAAIAIEAAELQERFLWKTAKEVTKRLSKPRNRAAVADELADVLIFSFLLAAELGVNPGEIVLRKLAKNARKYPVRKARGKALKYTEL